MLSQLSSLRLRSKSGDDLVAAARDGDLPRVRELLTVVKDVNYRCKELRKEPMFGATALHVAAQYGHDAIVNLLLMNAANARQLDYHGRSALHLASAHKGTSGVVSALLRVGSDLELCTMKGNTPLTLAAGYNTTDVVRVLLQGRANVRHVTEDLKTPLHYAAACSGSADMIHVILQFGADLINKVEADGNTALHFACKYGHVAAVKKLLELGADPTIKNARGETAAEVICEAKVEMDKIAKFDILSAINKSNVDFSLNGSVVLTDQGRAQKVKNAITGIVGSAGAIIVAGAVCTANPVALIQIAGIVGVKLVNDNDMLDYNQKRAGRIAARVRALQPVLDMLREFMAARADDVQEQHLVQMLTDNVLLLLEILLDTTNLLRKFSTKVNSPSALEQIVTFLRSKGYRDDIDGVDSDLQGCIGQLNLLLQTASFVDRRTGRASSAFMVDTRTWSAENSQDRTEDLARLEASLLKVVGGVEGLQQHLDAQRVVMNGQTITLQWVVDQLTDMQASSAVIQSHLERIEKKVDGVSEQVEVVSDKVDDLKKMTEEIWSFMNSSSSIKKSKHSRTPAFVISRSSICIDPEEMKAGMSGSYGTVVRGTRDLSDVAIKIYNYKLLGKKDQKDAIREALMLTKASHHNVVRCYGIVDDPDSNNSDCINGSLVMEWVGGGNLYHWLQDNDEAELRIRIMLAGKVAAGMRHLHEQKVIHGDLKPHNILVQDGGTNNSKVEVKICDFGLAKYNSTSMTMAKTASTSGYTMAYASPERLTDYERTYADDVYAFGILLYFVATSDTPYSSLPADELKDAVKSGKRPDLASWVDDFTGATERSIAQEVCALAQACWQQDASARPTFTDVYRRLEGMLKQLR